MTVSNQQFPQFFKFQNSHLHSPVFFMTELKLLRMEPILLRSTLATAAAVAATGSVTSLKGCSVATDGSLVVETGADASGWVRLSVCSSTEKEKYGARALRNRLDRNTLDAMMLDKCSYFIFIFRLYNYFFTDLLHIQFSSKNGSLY